MERVEGIEPSHQPWQGRRLPLHHTRFKMVDRKRLELFPKACKAPVLPLSLTAHLKILHQYIVFVKSKNLPYPIWIRFVRVRHTGVYRVPHAVGRFHPTRTFTKMVGMENFAISTSCLQNRPSTFDITSRLKW